MIFKYALTIVVVSNVFCLTQSSNILGIFWTPTKSHHILGSALLQALAEKGHNVTMLSPYEDDVNIPTFRQKKLEGIAGTFGQIMNPNVSIFQQTKMMYPILIQSLENFWQNEAIQELINTKEHYDVVIIMTFFNDGILAIPYHLKIPTIWFSPFGSTSLINRYVANPNLPYSTNMQISDGIPNTFIGRLLMATMNMLLSSIEDYLFNPTGDRILREYLPNVPSISELQKNVDLVLVNSHHSIETPRPYVPNMIQIGGFYAQKIKTLPTDLKEYLDSAKDGAILFSFGTNMKIANIDKDKLDAILQGLKKIAPMKVVFKSEIDLDGIPSNVVVKKWLPQNDILAHPNIRAFVSHGGLGGITEAVFYGVPMLGIPLFADQKTNILNARNTGYVVMLNYEDITPGTFYHALKELLGNSSYTEVSKKRSSLLRNQVINPLDNAIWWVEHIIEHKGGEHLKNIGMDLEWYQLYMVDIMLFFLMVLLVLVFLMFILIKYVLRKVKAIVFSIMKTKTKKIKMIYTSK
ncbi:hypothetical protein HHI36_000015 [Cryptolaemus montrouzieri]|uniref:UDP-glucuronosyltransferase n=1 Tax=Cryptolaemus montrouzieri TaxID=559131 RepID=A0ABD2P3P4_9CUCU